MVVKTAAETMIVPALRAYHRAREVARHHTPGGRLLEVDCHGIRRRVARDHGITPEDLQRWYDAMSSAQRRLVVGGAE